MYGVELWLHKRQTLRTLLSLFVYFSPGILSWKVGFKREQLETSPSIRGNHLALCALVPNQSKRVGDFLLSSSVSRYSWRGECGKYNLLLMLWNNFSWLPSVFPSLIFLCTPSFSLSLCQMSLKADIIKSELSVGVFKNNWAHIVVSYDDREHTEDKVLDCTGKMEM